MSGLYFSAKEDTVPFGDMIPIENGELPTSAALGVAWDYGWTRGVTSSLARFTEQAAETAGFDQFNDLFKKPEQNLLDPKEANDRYGVPGALSFSSPIRESVAQILRDRKDEEIAQQFVLDKAKGLQKVGVFGAELLAGVLDPAALMAGFIPIVPEAKYLAWTNRSVIGGRALAGAIEGAVGNALVEPIIYGQAAYEQADYGPIESLINIVAGGVFGSGLHVVGGKFTDWLHSVQMRHHLRALQTAINQAGNGQRVEVTPILGAEPHESDAVEVVFDSTPEPATAVPSSQLLDPQAAGEVAVAAELNVVSPKDILDFWTNNKGQDISFELKDGGVVVAEPVMIDEQLGVIYFNDPTDPINVSDIQSVSIPSLPPITPTPLVGDTDDGLQVFMQARHVEALNNENLVPEGTGQLGSNVGDIYTDKATGKKYYVKLPPPDKVEQSRQEFLAYAFYKMGSQNVPDVRPVMQDGQFIGVASEWVEGAYTPKSQGELYAKLKEYKAKDPAGFEKFVRGIVFDMWLANWDWAAAGNIIFTPDGVPMRIDYGGSLQYRAMGAKKTAEDFSEVVTELTSFLYPASTSKAKIHNQAAWEVLQIADDGSWQRGVNDLVGITDDDISLTVWKMGLPTDDAADIAAALIARRIAILEKYAQFVDPSALKSAEFFTHADAIKYVEDQGANWKPLTAAAATSLQSYKGIGYMQLNEWLRSVKVFSAHLVDHFIKVRDAMDLAVQGFVFPHETYLWRGGIPKKIFKQFGVKATDDLAQIRKKLLGSGIGHVVTDKGYVSTSAKKFTSWGKAPETIAFRIKVPKGQTAAVPSGLSGVDGEAEFVLPRDTSFLITDVFLDKSSGQIVVNVKVVPSSSKIKPIKSEAAMKMAEKHFDDFSSAADDQYIDAELAYSLKESMRAEEWDKVVDLIDKDSAEIMADMKAATPESERESFEKIVKQLTEDYDRMVEQGNAMAKGAMAAYPCVIKNANL